MVDSVGNIAITVGANVGDFVTDMGTAGNAVGGFSKKTRELVNTLGAYAAAAAAAGAVVIAGLYVSASEAIDRQAKLARAISATTAGVQSLEYAADLAGVAHEELSAASGKLNQKLGQAISVGGAAAKELDRLGLSAKELTQMDANDRMAVIADRLVALKYNSAQSAASLKELGLKGNEVVAMMMDGGEQFRLANKELRELNVLVSDTDASKIEAANDAWSKAKIVMTGIANTLAVHLAPYMQVIAEYLHNASVASGGFKDQIGAAIKSALNGFAKLADLIQGLRVVFKGIELVAVAFGAAVISVFEGVATLQAKLMDAWVAGANLAIAASNKLFGTNQELLSMPSESDFMTGLHEAADAARNKVSEIRAELGQLAMQKMPSEAVKKYLEDVANAKTETKNFKGFKGEMPAENEEKKKKRETADNILDGLRAGTEGMRAELEKRKEVLDIYRNNQLALDASYYTQQLNDIKISEQIKQAEIIAATQKEDAQRAERKTQNLERVAEDKIAVAAIIAEYDAQEILAKQIKENQLTQIQEDAIRARTQLAQRERMVLIDIAMGLGQQVMQVVQGHSRKLFELGKVAAISSAGYEGAKSAVSAWRWGMEVGGPPGAAIAAGASLLKTASLIQSIKDASYGGSGGAVASSGGGDSAASSVAASPNAGSTVGANTGSVMHVKGLDPSHLFTGSAVQTIAQGLIDYQKDGGKVVFEA